MGVIDKTGRRYGKLTVINRHGSAPNKQATWLCKCDCGNYVVVVAGNLQSGNTNSCGCNTTITCIERSTIHGMKHTRFYRIWKAMKARCNNPNTINYKYYGERGVKVIPEWDMFENFHKDMYTQYCDHVLIFGNKNTTIDRKDTNGNYCKYNCRWATIAEQANNKRNTRRTA
jgi:hypothetical protein